MISGGANAALIGLGYGNAAEREALAGTLTSLGHTVTSTIDGSLDMLISAPGIRTGNFIDTPYLQISDWGQGGIGNTFSRHAQGTSVSISLDGQHDILTGLDLNWDTLGFWNYGYSSSYIGTANIDGLANAVVQGADFYNALAVRGDEIYIGWNVYGVDATANDVQLLSNSIEFLTTGSVSNNVPVPATLSLFALAMLGLGLRKRNRS